VLGNLLSYISHENQLLPLLHTFENLRLPRASETQRQSRANQKIFHLDDGPEQEARDGDMRIAAAQELRRAEREAAGLDDDTEDTSSGNANQWVSAAFLMFDIKLTIRSFQGRSHEIWDPV
jgi:salicylate hydroxylase